MSHIEEITDQFDETHLSASSSSSPSRTSTSTSYSSSASLGSFYDSGTLEKNPSSTSSSSYTGPKIEEITDEDEAAEAAAVSTEHLTTSDGSNLLESTSSTSSDGSVQSLSGADGVSTPTVVPSIEEILNPNSAAQTVAKDKEKALEAKNKGNQFFSRQKFEEAIECYSEAIALCPENDVENGAIYFSNRAACFLMLNNNERTIEDCTNSLSLVPRSIKPLTRRAKAYEKLDQLHEAVEDWKVIVEIDPKDRDNVRQLKQLEEKLKVKNEKMKDEMVGKLKDLGNTILGKFGMSLDNFKAVQDPNTGSYSISFQK